MTTYRQLFSEHVGEHRTGSFYGTRHVSETFLRWHLCVHAYRCS